MSALEGILSKTERTIRLWEDKAREERHSLAILRELVARLPPGLPYVDAHTHGAYAAACIKFRAVDLAAARPLVEALPPVPAVKVRDGCCSIRPAGEAPQGDELTPIFGVWVDFDCVRSPSMQVCWFTRVGDAAIKVETDIDAVHRYARWAGERRVVHGQVVLANRSFTHNLTSANRIKWWTPLDSHLKVTVYWPAETSADAVFRPSDSDHVTR